MTASTLSFPLGLTYVVCSASLAGLFAVNRPVNTLLSFWTLASRAAPAAAQASCEVTSFMNSHMPPAFGESFGMAKAEPVAMVIADPSLALIGTADRSMLSPKPASTLTYHCSNGIAPIWSLPLANSLPAPKKSQVSRKDLKLAHPPWALTRSTANCSASTTFGSFRVGLPSAATMEPPLIIVHRGRNSGTLGSNPIVEGLPSVSLYILVAAALIPSQFDVSRSAAVTPAASATRLFTYTARIV